MIRLGVNFFSSGSTSSLLGPRYGDHLPLCLIWLVTVKSHKEKQSLPGLEGRHQLQLEWQSHLVNGWEILLASSIYMWTLLCNSIYQTCTIGYTKHNYIPSSSSLSVPIDAQSHITDRGPEILCGNLGSNRYQHSLGSILTDWLEHSVTSVKRDPDVEVYQVCTLYLTGETDVPDQPELQARQRRPISSSLLATCPQILRPPSQRSSPMSLCAISCSKKGE